MGNPYNLTEAQVLMKEILDPRIQKFFEEVGRGWNKLPDGKAEFMNGRGVQFVGHMEPNPSAQYYAETDVLPDGDTVVRKRLTILFTRFAFAGLVTGDAIHTTQRETLITGITSRVKEDTSTAIKMLSEDFYEDGTGVKATLTSYAGSGAATSVTLTFDTPFGTRRVRPRGKYWLVNSSTGIAVGGSGTEVVFTCSSKTDSSRQAVLTSASTAIAAASYILVQVGSYNKAIKGLRYHVNDATGDYQGLTNGRTNYPSQLNAVIRDASSSALTVAMLDELEAKALYKQGVEDGIADLEYLSSPAQVQTYRSFGYHTTSGAITRKVTDSGNGKAKLDLGFPAISHNGHVWEQDIDCPDSELFMLRWDTFGKFFIKPLSLIDDDGQTLRMIPSGSSFKEQYLYFLNFKGDIGCMAPRMNMRIKNLTAPANVNGNY